MKKGQKMTAESKTKMSKARKEMYSKGLKPFWSGKKRPDISEGARKRMSGKRLSAVTKNKLSISHSGPKHWNWKGGKSKNYKTGYYSKRYKEWRKSVFERDNYTCQECGSIGYITAHHIKSFAKFINLRYELSNGITLCEECHKKTDNYKGRAK